MMQPEVLVAVLSVVGTVAGSAFGVLSSNRLVNYRLKMLEDKMDKHNDFIERLTKVEVKLDEMQGR
jgi:hypothetical protein